MRYGVRGLVRNRTGDLPMQPKTYFESMAGFEPAMRGHDFPLSTEDPVPGRLRPMDVEDATVVVSSGTLRTRPEISSGTMPVTSSAPGGIRTRVNWEVGDTRFPAGG